MTNKEIDNTCVKFLSFLPPPCLYTHKYMLAPLTCSSNSLPYLIK
jgi:hypothetical protein